MTDNLENLSTRIHKHLGKIYGDSDESKINTIAEHILELVSTCKKRTDKSQERWTEQSIMMIVYGDTISHDGEAPLETLSWCLHKYFNQSITVVHILPFFPSSSDDGFSVIDYYEVDQSLGDWRHIKKISETFQVMSDVVINHGSSKSKWFNNFKNGEGKGCDYFLSFTNHFDTKKVIRPRTSPLLQKIHTHTGEKYVWCTFSHDQIDYDFSNQEVLIEFIKIILFYFENGVTILRFDAIAFLWKNIHTNCINQPETHEIVRLFRSIMEYVAENSVLVTETNTPARENVSYFGNANEAQWIYNFSLPPILIYTILSGDSSHLEKLTMSMPPSQLGTAYLNFIASHDGIGLRPAEDFLSEKDINSLINLMKDSNGQVSYRTNNEGLESPYEINISLFDAMSKTFSNEDKLVIERFVCIHTIMMSLEGVPAFYFHSLIGTKNDIEKFKKSQINRSLNRYKYNRNELSVLLENQNTDNFKVYDDLSKLVMLRKAQKAFHPNAVQFTLHLGKNLYGVWRQSLDKKQSIFCITNITPITRDFSLLDINLIGFDEWYDLISEDTINDLSSSIKLKPYQTMWITNS